jgi:hypothetical protein
MREMPNRDRAEPKLANDLNDNVEPKLVQSSTDKEDPIRDMPNNEICAPSRPALR